MKFRWMRRDQQKDLLIFCNGWGMDGQPLSHLQCIDHDLLIFYDYQDLQLPVELWQKIKGYGRISLISWSMGVWAGQKIFSAKKDLFSRSIAINGTLSPIDDRYGIPVKIFQDTLKGFNEKSRSRFYRRMCREKATLQHFLAAQPGRSLDNQRKELASLAKNVDCGEATSALYGEIIIADSDMIIPTENQQAFWRERTVTIINGYHYIFALFRSWREIMDFSSGQAKGQG
jgi:biotin synthesis protein BioG